MRVALVHDYLNEYGGAERVLEALAELWPEAPIYTAFAVPGSSGVKAFEGKKIITSWFQNLPFYDKLYSPLRFLIPWIWGSFDLSNYDLVITSASWYITKGLGEKEICYCHTPPRWLYGYETSIDWQKYWPVRVYAAIVGHFLRMYDFRQAQKVGMFVANSKNVAERIEKFYRRESVVIYPPVTHPQPLSLSKRGEYYLIVSRLVGGKGIEMAIAASKKYGFKLKIAGEQAGYNKFSIFNIEFLALREQFSNDFQDSNVQFLGRVDENKKAGLMARAKGFLALSRDEDFGITPVEAQMCGTPVIAFNGGGYRETVIDGKTGILFDDYSVEGLIRAIGEFGKIKWDRKAIRKHADRFSKKQFVVKVTKLVNQYLTPGPSPIIGEGDGGGEV